MCTPLSCVSKFTSKCSWVFYTWFQAEPHIWIPNTGNENNLELRRGA